MKKQYKLGDVVYFTMNPMWLRDKADTKAIVHSSFIGKDKKEYVVVEFATKDQNINYRLLPFNAIYDDLNGESNQQKLMRDPKYIFEIALRTGIYNEDRTLTTAYGGEYDLIDGVKYYADDDI